MCYNTYIEEVAETGTTKIIISTEITKKINKNILIKRQNSTYTFMYN